MTETWHGTPGGYHNHGCREACCRAAHYVELADRIRNKRAWFEEHGYLPAGIEHGTRAAYRDYGCKCVACREWRSIEARLERARAKTTRGET